MADEQPKSSEPLVTESVEKSEETNTENKSSELKENLTSFADLIDYENELRRVVGDADDNACTYAEGYKPRQPVYACRTCTPEGNAGICFGCGFNCHEGHDIIELYTKRRFKCDCGNEKFKQKCKLFEEKSGSNERNVYNHNYVNEYCTCSRPYPDPEGELKEDDLRQCVACEDWFHNTHSGLPETSEEFSTELEYMCKECSGKLPIFAKLAKDAPDQDGVICYKDDKEESTSEPSSFLLKNGWREKMCACAKCEDLYDKLGCDWIHDPDDSLDKYNEIAEKRMAEEDEQDMKELNKIISSQDKNVVDTVMQGVNHMKRKVEEFLRTSSELNREVTADHIKTLFEDIKKERQEEFSRRMEAISEGRVIEEEERGEEGEH